jgi:hypothetical protein
VFDDLANRFTFSRGAMLKPARLGIVFFLLAVVAGHVGRLLRVGWRSGRFRCASTGMCLHVRSVVDGRVPPAKTT